MNRLLPTALAALLASGCTLGPDYARPALAAPEQYRLAPEAATGEAYGQRDWRNVYRDPALVTLLERALASNLDLQIAVARIDQARASAGVARLGQLPQVSASASQVRNQISQELQPLQPRQRDTDTVQATASWDLDFWGRLRRLSEAARAELLAADYARDAVQVSLIGDVAAQYYTLLALDEQLAITRRTVASREKFVELTRAQHERGVVSGLDVANAEAQLATARANLPDLERQLAQGEDALSLLLGGYPAHVARGAADSIADEPLPPPGLPSTLLERRPDLRQAEAALVAANARVGAAKAALFPSLTLTGAVGTQSTALADLFSGPATIWSLGGNLVLPLVDANRNLYQLDLADARKREALLGYQKSVQGAFREVSDALVARDKSADLEHAQGAQVDALRRADEIALARYRIGFSSYFDVINAERDLFTAELSLSAARRNTRLAAVQLYRALGGGWTLPESADAGAAPDANATPKPADTSPGDPKPAS